jgi:uncharacterized protein
VSWPIGARIGIEPNGPHMQRMPEPITGATSCPICGKTAAELFRPFCTRRCRDVDLNRWLKGVYAVPVREEEDEDGAAAANSRDDAS